MPKSLRHYEIGDHALGYTNVFVKNFGEDLDEEKLGILFSKFGKVLSSVVMTDLEGKSKGFGFVSFENAGDAEHAVEQMNNSTIASGKLLTVCRAQKKNDRAADLKIKYDQIVKN